MPYSLVKEFADNYNYIVSDKIQKEDILINPVQSEKINYQIMDKDLGKRTPKERYNDNVAAIRLLFSLEKQGRNATKDEQNILSRYVGWGGLADAFDESKSNCRTADQLLVSRPHQRHSAPLCQYGSAGIELWFAGVTIS